MPAMLKEYVQKRIGEPLKRILKQGISPEKIAWSIAWGAILGIFPVPGTTTLLCVAAAIMLRLNLPVMQLANWLAYPLQLLLIVPFLAAGNTLFGDRPFIQDAAELIVQFRSDWFNAIVHFQEVLLHGVLVWLIVSPAAIVLLYAVVKPLLKSFSHLGFPMDSSQ